MIYDFSKRLVDILGSQLALILLFPFLVLVSIAIKLDSAGPILADTPMRAGKDGKLFKIYKFRSMVQNAQELLDNNPRLLAEYKKNSYKIFNDPRITQVGKFIRRFSIDEMPQFFNILKGEMSLVGPRAYYPYELDEQQKKYDEMVAKLEKRENKIRSKINIYQRLENSRNNDYGFLQSASIA